MRLFDAHNHLQDPALAGRLGEVERLVREGGVVGMVVNGTEEGDWEDVARLAARFEWVRPSYGLHPWRVNGRSADWRERLTERLDGGGALGEIGLDRWKETENFGEQVEVFRWQFAEGVRRDLPITVHCLRAWGPLMEALRELPRSERGFLVHAFGGSSEIGRELTNLGAYFSFSGSFLAQKRSAKAEVFLELPLDRLLVETDAPSMPLPPELDRYGDGVTNHPGNLIVAYEGLAKVRSIPVRDLAELVEANFQRMFG